MKAKHFGPAARAGNCYFYGETSEPDVAIEMIKEQIAKDEKLSKWRIALWETKDKNGRDVTVDCWDCDTIPDADQVMDMLEKSEAYTLVIAKNWNWFLIDEQLQEPNKQYCQWLLNRVKTFSSKSGRTALLILSETSMEEAIPKCLQKDFIHLEFPLPDREEISLVLDDIIKAASGSKGFVAPSEEEREQIIDSSTAMTNRELVNGYSFALVKDGGRIDPLTVADLQAKEVAKTAGVKLVRPSSNLNDLIGFDKVSKFALKMVKSKTSKGMMLLGPAGVGKSHFCEAFAASAGRKLLVVEFAELFGGLVGDSERLWREVIKIIRANAPCIVFCDEIEKGLAGVGGGRDGSGGVTQRSASQWLKFMSEPRDGVYIVATCNDISALPPEWIRAGRWDSAPFFIDLPTKEQADKILEFYKKKYNVAGFIGNMSGWSGAEIRQTCEIAVNMGVSIEEAKDYVIPISMTMGEKIKALRTWSKGRTLSVDVKPNIECKENNEREIAI